MVEFQRKFNGFSTVFNEKTAKNLTKRTIIVLNSQKSTFVHDCVRSCTIVHQEKKQEKQRKEPKEIKRKKNKNKRECILLLGEECIGEIFISRSNFPKSQTYGSIFKAVRAIFMVET